METHSFDVIVIGGGPAGENAGARAAAAGLEVALVERELLGGECSYWACMPSKALLRPGEALAAVARVPGAAEAIGGEIDIDAALERRDRLSANWDDAGQQRWAEEAGLKVVRGHGRLAGDRIVDVTADDGSVRRLEAARAVVVATGSAAAIPPIPGLAEAGVWDNREATTAKEVPARLLIIGGGVVGVEMAQAWRSLGAAEVTVVEMADRLLPREEPFAGEALAAAFERMGIEVITGAAVEAVSRSGTGGPLVVTVGGADIEADEVLVATGRRPLTEDIGLESVGIQPAGFLAVDDHMRVEGVNGGWLYAVGDVNGRALLTHTGKYQARIAGDHIAGRTAHVTARGDLTATPRVVFTDPSVAATGLTAGQAAAAGVNARSVDYQIGHVAGSAAKGRGIRGTCRLVVDEDTRIVMGATFVGPEVGELLHAATIAVAARLTVDDLWHAIPAFPTQSEIWLRLLEEYGL